MADKTDRALQILMFIGIAIALGVSLYTFFTFSRRYKYAGHLYTQVPKPVLDSEPVYTAVEHVVFYDVEGHRRVYVLDPVNSHPTE